MIFLFLLIKTRKNFEQMIQNKISYKNDKFDGVQTFITTIFLIFNFLGLIKRQLSSYIS